MNREERLDALLKDALSPEREAPPSAWQLSQAGRAVARRAADEDRRVGRAVSLLGVALAVAELLLLVIVMAVYPLRSGVGILLALGGFVQAAALLAGSAGSRAAIRRLSAQ